MALCQEVLLRHIKLEKIQGLRGSIGGVQSVKTQWAGVQRRERRRMKGREIHAKEIVRLSRIGRLKVKLRCFRET